MNAPAPLTQPDSLALPVPLTPLVSPVIALALADRTYVFDGSPAWTAEHAVGVLRNRDGMADAPATLQALQASAGPVPRGWLGDRLTMLWTMFMASRAQIDADALTVWMAEYLRLLGDLPHDIVAQAIDRAVQGARHGFIPSVGEIRTLAEPAVAERRRMIERLIEVRELLR